jgi:hypothetical protein
MHEADVRQEARLVQQVAEASLTMSEALSSASQARCTAKLISDCRARASSNLSSASMNRKLAAEQTVEAQSLQRTAQELSAEAEKLQVFSLSLELPFSLVFMHYIDQESKISIHEYVFLSMIHTADVSLCFSRIIRIIEARYTC